MRGKIIALLDTFMGMKDFRCFPEEGELMQVKYMYYSGGKCQGKLF